MMMKAVEPISTLTLRTVTMLEVASVVLSVLVAVWVVVPLYPGNRFLIALAALGGVGLMIHSHRVRGETRGDLGFTSAHFWRAAKLVIGPTVSAAAILIALGYWSGGLHLDDHFGRKLFFLPLWGVIQQYILQGFIYRRLRTVIANRSLTMIFAAGLFAFVHLPNPALTIMTFVGGVIWTWVYERAPNLYAIGLSHGILSLTAMSTLPPWLLESLSVGYKHFLYQTF